MSGMAKLRLWGLRIFRLGLLAGMVVLFSAQGRRQRVTANAEPPLTEVKQIFPGAVELRAVDGERWEVRTAGGETLGSVAMTSPRGDRHIGYCGPSNLLVGLDLADHIVGVRLLHSEDTPEHVEMILARPEFFSQFQGRTAASLTDNVDGVSGATLTSMAMAEAMAERLRGAAISLRFPRGVTLKEARELFDSAAALEESAGKFRVVDAEKNVLGYLLRTSPEADNLSGFRGPTECLVALAADGSTIREVRVRQSFDNDSYVQQIRDDPTYLKSFAGRSLETLATLDFAAEEIEGVSGATQTSYAVAETLKRRAQRAVAATTTARQPWISLRWQDFLLLGLVVGGGVMAFTNLRGQRWPRLIWQIVLVVGFGILCGDLLSLSLFAGWAKHGVPWHSVPGLVTLAATALLVPWSTRRQLYCHHLCPHGAAQELLGRIRRKKWTVPARYEKWLVRIPFGLLAAAVLALAGGFSPNFATWEPFDAWTLRAGLWISSIIAVLGLLASIFVPSAYCKYGCPTGALLKFVRSPGQADHWSAKDTAAVVVAAVATVAVVLG